jgi:NADPH-ferrihemoprotein reductase
VFLCFLQVPLGTGDDDGTMEEDWAAWRSQMWQILCDKYGLSKTVGADTYSTTYRVRLSPELSQTSDEGGADATLTAKRILAFDSKYKVVEVPLAESREMRTTTDSLVDGSTLHLEFDLTNVRMPPYVTADNLGLHPRNPFKLVARCAKRLGVHPSAIVLNLCSFQTLLYHEFSNLFVGFSAHSGSRFS